MTQVVLYGGLLLRLIFLWLKFECFESCECAFPYDEDVLTIRVFLNQNLAFDRLNDIETGQ